MSSDDEIIVSLTPDEALVLFELLQRFDRTGALSIAHEAENRALWALTSSLEKVLAEPFRGDYASLLAKARSRL
jgi:hypothetical protein